MNAAVTSSTPQAVTTINNAAFYDRLADVQLPPEPALWPLAVVIVTITLIITALGYLGYRRYTRAAAPATTTTAPQQALNRLDAIEQAWLAHEIDTREAAYRLTTVLRLGLELPQLTTHCPQWLSDQRTQWQQTISQFEQLRYQPLNAQRIEPGLFDELRRWLTITDRSQRGERDV